MTNEPNGTDILRIGLRKMSLVEMVEADPLLLRAALMAVLPEADRLVVLASGRLVIAAPEEDISKHPDLLKGLFFILEGTVELTCGGDLGAVDLDKGDLFGLDVIVNGAERFAAVAKSGAKLAWFPAVLLLRLAGACEPLAKMLRGLATERRQMAGEGGDFLDRW
ncbi:MAG: hypothetical protein JRF33_14755 [Deltaproteobacteria bacterium]|nr:hypothetical protein [Deltaproteobacteria bacterium]